jgi:hypothetical protein
MNLLILCLIPPVLMLICLCVSIRYSNPSTATVSYCLRSMEHCNVEILFFIRFVIVFIEKNSFNIIINLMLLIFVYDIFY